MSTGEVAKSPEQIHEEIDSGLDQLENKILDNLAPDVYEKNPDGTFNLKLLGEELDIDLKTPEQLVEAFKLTSQILQIYRENGYSPEDNPFYEEEADFSKSQMRDSVSAVMDIHVDNFFNTKFLTEESFIKVFKNNPRRGGEILPKYITFLNSVASKPFNGTYEQAIDTNNQTVLQETEYEVHANDTMYSIINEISTEVELNVSTLASIREYIKIHEGDFQNIIPNDTIGLTAYSDKVILSLNHKAHVIPVKTGFIVNGNKLEIED